jgi:hypothetical protein
MYPRAGRVVLPDGCSYRPEMLRGWRFEVPVILLWLIGAVFAVAALNHTSQYTREAHLFVSHTSVSQPTPRDRPLTDVLRKGRALMPYDVTLEPMPDTQILQVVGHASDPNAAASAANSAASWLIANLSQENTRSRGNTQLVMVEPAHVDAPARSPAESGGDLSLVVAVAALSVSSTLLAGRLLKPWLPGRGAERLDG